MGKVVEGVVVGTVGELGVRCWEPLQALQRYGGEVSGEVSVLRDDHRASCHEAVY